MKALSSLFLPLKLLLFAGLCLSTGCAFDVVYEKTIPTTFEALAPTEQPQDWILSVETGIRVEGTNFPTVLKSGTRWRQKGHVPAGDVFATTDQIVTVVGSNMHEAQIVVKNDAIVGFYLPVEKAFAPAREPKPVKRVSAAKTEQGT